MAGGQTDHDAHGQRRSPSGRYASRGRTCTHQHAISTAMCPPRSTLNCWGGPSPHVSVHGLSTCSLRYWLGSRDGCTCHANVPSAGTVIVVALATVDVTTGEAGLVALEQTSTPCDRVTPLACH